MTAINDNGSAKNEASPFRAAIAEWKIACAEVSALDAHDDAVGINNENADRRMDAALKARADAEWKLLRTPAAGIVEMRWRALAVQEMFSRAVWEGEPTDNRHRLMLDALVSEILSSRAED
jgi:hypothetical protein